MKKLIALVILLMVAPAVCYGFGGTAPARKAAYPYLIDNFADGNFDKDPEWFVFDRIVPTVVANTQPRGEGAPRVGDYSLNLKGTAADWYVGGIGVVLGIDGTLYETFNMNVYGYGENSGVIKIELYDDDSGDSEIQVDKDWKPIKDDLWFYELTVDWTGWRHISIPFSEFKVSGGGNKKWDPHLKDGSGGLVKMQFIAVATSQTGSVNFNVDTIELGLK